MEAREVAYDVVETHVLLLEVLPVAKRTHANAHTLHLARVGWTNTSLRCTDLHAAAVQLVEPIADLVEVEHDVSTVRHEKSTVQNNLRQYLSATVIFSRFRASISSNRVKMFTTQPLPIIHFALGWTMPIGTRWKATGLPSIIMV